MQTLFQEISSPTYAESSPDTLNQEFNLFGNVGEDAADTLTTLQGIALSSANSGTIAASAAFADMWTGAYPQVAQEASFSGSSIATVSSDTFQNIGSRVKEVLQDKLLDYVVDALEEYVPGVGLVKTAYDAGTAVNNFIESSENADRERRDIAGRNPRH